MNAHLTLVGMNHRTASVDARERFSLAGCGASLWPAGFDRNLGESIILSTCNRVEFLHAGEEPMNALMLEKWAETVGQPLAELQSSTYVHNDAAAVSHIFEVAASLDSMVLGEPQILGQLKAAYRKAVECGKTGPVLSRLMHKAFSVGKRVRNETAVAANAVSVSYAAVELSRRIFGSLSGHTAMLVGAGEMAELAAMHLLQGGAGRIILVNRTHERALELAIRLHGEARPFGDLAQSLADADIIITSTGSKTPVIGAAEVAAALKKRRNNPMFFIDIAVPRDVHPEVNSLDNVYLYDIDDLKDVVEENRAGRREEAIKARAIIAEETDNFMSWLNILDAKPTILEIVGAGEQAAKQELARTLKKLGPISKEQREALEIMALAIARKLTHAPLAYLKNGPEEGRLSRINTVRAILDLDCNRKRHG